MDYLIVMNIQKYYRIYLKTENKTTQSYGVYKLTCTVTNAD